MGHMGVLQGHRVTGLCVAMGLDGFRITVIGSDWMVGSDGVTWSYGSHGWYGRGEVGAGIPELWATWRRVIA